MKIEWNKVTWYSELLAIILFLGVLCLGFYIGEDYESTRVASVATTLSYGSTLPVSSVKPVSGAATSSFPVLQSSAASVSNSTSSSSALMVPMIPMTGSIPTLNTLNWKSYQNSKYDFSLLYPPDQTAVDFSDSTTTYVRGLKGIGVDIMTDLGNADYGGTCESVDQESLAFERTVANANPLPEGIINANSPNVDFSTGGYYKVLSAKEYGQRILLNVDHGCYGDDASPDDLAGASVSAEVFIGDAELEFYMLNGLDFENKFKIKDSDALDDAILQLMNGTYQGPEQQQYNEFVNSLMTLNTDSFEN